MAPHRTSHRLRTARWLSLLATVVLLSSACDGVLDVNGPPAAQDAAAQGRDDAASDGVGQGTDAAPPAQTSSQPAPAGDDADTAAAPADPEPADPAPADPEPADEPGPAEPQATAAAGSGAYGAGATGPGAEQCETAGTRVSSTGQIRGNGVFLLAGGTYGSTSVPAGATVKPYDCQKVTINGTVSLGDGATLAGVTARTDSNWVIRIGGRGITVRNSTINGGSIEAVRIFNNADDVRLTGNNLDGGRNNHTVKVIAEDGAGHPSRIRIDHNLFTKQYYGTASEDLLQLEGHHDVTVTNNTFENNPRGEDGLDVKQGTDGIVVERNDFRGGNIKDECLMVGGGYAHNMVRDNRFSGCNAISLGAGYDTWPWWRFEGNHLTDSQLRLRQSQDAEVVGNDMVGGLLTLGIPAENDNPKDLEISGNTFVDVQINNRLRYSYSCSANVLEDVSGSTLSC